jgi:hypothetical protein
VLPQLRLCFNLGANFIPATGASARESGQRQRDHTWRAERLQSVDLTLRLPIAPGFEDGVANRLNVLPQRPDKASHAVDATCAGIVQPDVQPLRSTGISVHVPLEHAQRLMLSVMRRRRLPIDRLEAFRDSALILASHEVNQGQHADPDDVERVPEQAPAQQAPEDGGSQAPVLTWAARQTS